ncbi:MAG TPA: SDR family oxidoreductase [Thermoplasmata archaeon]|nr:SDR family oxidoreductase [Thermoplasmata archaeon]
MTDTFSLDGRVALVTGGSRGIGRAIVLALSKAGAEVTFSYRENAAAAQSTVQAAREAGRSVDAVASDAADESAVVRLVEGVRRERGHLDIVVAGAGIVGPVGWDMGTPDEWQRVVATNVEGPYALVRAAAPALAERGGCAILISSIAGLIAAPEEIVYSASKSALSALVRGLALTLAPDVRVNAIAPGWVETDMTKEVRADPRTERAIRRYIPLGRWGHPEDVAAAAVFLAGNGARFITGETLVVDGGNQIAWRIGLER